MCSKCGYDSYESSTGDEVIDAALFCAIFALLIAVIIFMCCV